MVIKALYLVSGSIFFMLSGLLAPAGFAQRSSRWANYDAVTTYRIGTQAVGWSDLNQALQQAGYGTLPKQLTMLGFSTQVSRANQPLALHSEFGISLGSATTVTNGTNKARAGFYYAKLGVSYKVVGSDRFQLAPQIGLISLPFQLRVQNIGNSTPPLSTVLTNPGSAQTATLKSGSLGLDAGLTATLRFPYSQRQLDCYSIERSFVIGLDAGYRIASRAGLNSAQEISAANPAIQLSGWYAGLRLGFGTRVRATTASPIVP